MTYFERVKIGYTGVMKGVSSTSPTPGFRVEAQCTGRMKGQMEM